MKILAIETSCDDTGIAILDIPEKKVGDFSAQGEPASGWNVLSNIISSQIEIHKKYGGVYPMLAKREHQNNLIPTFKKALKTAGLLKASKKQISDSKTNTLKEIFSKESDLYENLKKFLEKYEKPFDYAQGKPAIDLITVTEGPGLEPCLWVGVNFAKALSFFWNIPVVPVNHIEAHILVNFIKNKKIDFPAISLVVS